MHRFLPDIVLKKVVFVELILSVKFFVNVIGLNVTIDSMTINDGRETILLLWHDDKVMKILKNFRKSFFERLAHQIPD